jgi:eukaryotic-like serine/threonine-protein kinase
VTVHDSGLLADGRYGLVMEYIAGVPLDRWSRALDSARGREARRRALRDRLAVMVKVCDAILCAHQHSIIHRDLKPANILVDAAGEPHILDFGIAHDAGFDQHTRLTHTGEFAGTLAYTSPEQLLGDPTKVDSRADIYSLGVIMYELVSGRMPYAVDGAMSQIIRSVESAEPAPLPRRTRDPDAPLVDGEVSTIILKAMSKDPARRYQTAAGLRDDVVRYLAGDAIEARRDSTWYMLRKTAARHRLVVTAAGLILILLAAFSGAMALQAHRLAARGRELASALSDSNIERGRMHAAAGNIALAEETIWPELLRADISRTENPPSWPSGSPEALRAYWALWDIYRRSSGIVSLRTRGTDIELVYFDDDGRRLCALDDQGMLTSWSVGTWEAIRQTSLAAQPAGGTLQAALAPGGRIAIFGGGLLRIVDPENGAIIAQADDPQHLAVTGAFSADGARLATIGRDDRLRIRDARSLATVITMDERALCQARPWFCRPIFSLDGRLVASARPDGSIGVWNAQSGVLERTLPLPDSLHADIPGGVAARSIAFGTDGSIAAAIGYFLVVWPPDEGPPRNLGAPFAHIRSIAFLPGSGAQMLLSSGTTAGGAGGATIIWDLTTGERLSTFLHADPMTTGASSPDARLIAAGCESGAVRIYSTAQEPHISIIRPATGRGALVALSPSGQMLAMADTPEGQSIHGVLLMDLASRATINRVKSEDRLRHLAFTPDGSSLLGCEEGGRISQWDVPSGTLRRVFEFPEPGEHRRNPDPATAFPMWGFNQMRASPDGRLLARSRDDGLIGLWNLPTGSWIDWLDGGSSESITIDFSPDSGVLIAQDAQRCILWDVHTRSIIRSIAVERGYPTVRFSGDGSVIAHSVSGHIQFLDSKTLRILSQNKDPRSAGLGMMFHPDNTILCAAAFDSSIRLWDPRTGGELLSLQKHTALIRSVVLTPDGNTLISSDVSGLVLAWDLSCFGERIQRELAYRASPGAPP